MRSLYFSHSIHSIHINVNNVYSLTTMSTLSANSICLEVKTKMTKWVERDFNHG